MWCCSTFELNAAIYQQLSKAIKLSLFHQAQCCESWLYWCLDACHFPPSRDREKIRMESAHISISQWLFQHEFMLAITGWFLSHFSQNFIAQREYWCVLLLPRNMFETKTATKRVAFTFSAWTFCANRLLTTTLSECAVLFSLRKTIYDLSCASNQMATESFGRRKVKGATQCNQIISW